MLVTRRLHGVDGIPFQAESLCDHRRDDCRVVVHTSDRSERILLRKEKRLRRGSLGILQRKGDKPAQTGGLKSTGLLRRDGQLDADLPRSLHERRGAVRRGGQQQQQSGGRRYFFEAWK